MLTYLHEYAIFSRPETLPIALALPLQHPEPEALRQERKGQSGVRGLEKAFVFGSRADAGAGAGAGEIPSRSSRPMSTRVDVEVSFKLQIASLNYS